MGIHLPNQYGRAPTGTLNGSKLSLDVHVANTAAIPVSATNTANGAPGAAIPAEATLVGGTQGGTLRALAVNASGEAKIDQLSTLATEATLSAASAKLPATLGQKAMAASMAVVVASDQSAVPVSAAALPLPTGAATEATLAAASAKLPAALGQTTMAASLSVAIASNQSAVPVTASNLPATVDTNLGTPGASTPRVAAMLGVGAAAVSSSNPVPVAAAKGRSVVTTVRNDYSSVNVTAAAWVQLVAALGSEVNEFEIFDSSGETLELGIGAAAAETRLIIITPGGNGRVPVQIAAGTRVSIRAISATASVGEVDINFYS